MKRKLLVTIFCFVIFSVFMLGLMGCKHEHTFSEQWSSNETHHWIQATCDHDLNELYNTHTFDMEQSVQYVAIKANMVTVVGCTM